MARLVLSYFVLDTAIKQTLTICDRNLIFDVNTVYQISFDYLTLDHIKKMIWNVIKSSEESAGKACELKLYKIKIPNKEKRSMLETLNENYRNQVDITNELGEELDPTDAFRKEDWTLKTSS